MAHLHQEKGIVHRDIKLDNVVVSSHDCRVKLTDFTVAREIQEGDLLFDTEGTPGFTAPECAVVGKVGYQPKPTDVWSFGVCLFTYLTEKVPFYGEGELEIQIKSQKDALVMPAEFSDDLKDLMGRALEKEPEKRITTKELLEHRWFKL